MAPDHLTLEAFAFYFRTQPEKRRNGLQQSYLLACANEMMAAVETLRTQAKRIQELEARVPPPKYYCTWDGCKGDHISSSMTCDAQ